MEHEEYMRQALELARLAMAEGEVPVGCVIVRDGAVVGRGRNRRETAQTALGHAELEAIAQAGRTLDTITREVINAGTVVQFADGKVDSRDELYYTSAEDNCNLTVDAVKRAVRFLETQDAPKIDGWYVGIIHPYCKYDLMKDPDWKNPHEYVDTENVYQNEIGELYGVRFVQSSRAKVFSGADLASDSRTLLVNGASVTSTKTVPFDGGAVKASALVGRMVSIGGTVTRVTANTTSQLTVEDDVTAYVEYPNGATGVFISTTGEFPGTNRFEIVLDRATILCENGKLSVFELEDSQQHFIDTCPEGFGRMDGGFIDIETDGENPQHDGVLRAFAAAILRGEPLIARGEEGINGLTLSNAMFLSSWLNETVTLPLDEELFYAELKRRIDSSKAKKESQDTVVFNVEGTFGS